MIDVGGGDSRLVDALIERGLRCVTVLDVSHEALVRAATRLGAEGNVVSWLEADVTTDWRRRLKRPWQRGVRLFT